MEAKIAEIAQRISGLRKIMDISQEDMAKAADVTLEEYRLLESGTMDFSFTFLLKCAERFGVDMIELLTGEQPHLNIYTVVKKGKGLPINRRQGFIYEHLSHRFRNKLAEPFLVTTPFSAQEQDKPIRLSTHDGHEFDYILKGSLKIQVDDHVEILNEGDAVYYDSSRGHGMIAVGGEDCVFLAVVIKTDSRRQTYEQPK